MNIRNHVGGAATALLLALMPLNVSTELGHAAPISAKSSCESRGYHWFEGKGCADKKCTYDGKSYEPGSTRRGPPILGMKRNTYWCDGLTGNWVLALRRPDISVPKTTQQPSGNTQ